MLRKTGSLLLLLGASLLVRSQQMMPVDTLRHALRTNISDTTRLQLLCKLTNAYLWKWPIQRANQDTALLVAREAVTLSKKLGTTPGIQDARLLMAKAYCGQYRFDSAAAVLQDLTDSFRLRTMLNIVSYALNLPGTTRKDFDTALAWSNRALLLAQREHNLSFEAEAWQGIAGYYMKIGDPRSARINLMRGWDTIRRARHLIYEFHYLTWLALYSNADTSTDKDMRNAFHQATVDAATLPHPGDPSQQRQLLDLFTQAAYLCYAYGRTQLSYDLLTLCNQISGAWQLHYPYPLGILATEEASQGELTKALQHALEGVRITESVPGPPADGSGYAVAARVYSMMGNLPLALEYYKKAYDVYFRFPYSMGDPATGVRAVSNVYLRLGKPAEALAFLDSARKKLLFSIPRDWQMLAASQGDTYAALHQNAKAETAYLEALRNAERKEDRRTSFITLAKFYVSTGSFGKARNYLSLLVADSNIHLLNWVERQNIFSLYYQVDSAAGDWRRAAAHLRLYQQAYDSVFNATKNKQLAEVTARFETEKKDHNIALLNTEARLRETDLRRSRLLRNVFIAGSGALILLLAILFSRYRLKQQNARLLEARRQELDESNHRLLDLNTRQQRLLAEKEWLMREIHHRVKNNLQLVISLLNSQASTLKDESAVNALGDIKSRIRSISLIHQKLYQEGHDTIRIDVADYIRELIGFLEDSLGPRQRIWFRLDIDPVDLDVAQTVPIGLILNEAVTNSIKYAFPPSTQNNFPTIAILLKTVPGDQIRLVVADNGVGLPEGASPRRTSMGLQLIRTLGEQLDGETTIANENGLRITVTFPQSEQPPYQNRTNQTPPYPATL